MHKILTMKILWPQSGVASFLRILFLSCLLGTSACSSQTITEVKEKLLQSAFQSLPLCEVYEMQMDTEKPTHEINTAIKEFQKQLEQLPKVDPNGEHDNTRTRLTTSIAALKSAKQLHSHERARIELYVETPTRWFVRKRTPSGAKGRTELVFAPGSGLAYRNDSVYPLLFVEDELAREISMALDFYPRFKLLNALSKETSHESFVKDGPSGSVLRMTWLAGNQPIVATIYFDWNTGEINSYKEALNGVLILFVEKQKDQLICQTYNPLDGISREKAVYLPVMPYQAEWQHFINWNPLLSANHTISINVNKKQRELSSNELQGKPFSEISFEEPESQPFIWKPR